MALPTWGRNSAAYHVHHRATKTAWEKSLARALSAKKAQYNPVKSMQEWKAIEKQCVESCLDETEITRIPEIAITDLHNASLQGHKFYADCRRLFVDDNFVAGYCSSEETPYIFVRWNSDGMIHGQPASIAFLRTKGATL